uniref:Putative acyl-carrier phosphodiesterase n=1 Tax=Sphingobacterium sp. (strain 21) TaxID=743722 RepID=F4CAD4_SPHS2
MKKILHIISSPKKANSASRVLGKKVAEKLKEKFQHVEIKEYDLNTIPHLSESHINAFFTSTENRTDV